MSGIVFSRPRFSLKGFVGQSRLNRAANFAVEALEGRQLLSVSLTPTADTYVRDGSYSNTNFGSSADLLVKLAPSGQGFVRHAYLKFDLTGQQPITSAVLDLYGSETPGTSDPSVSILAHGVTSNSWTQSSVTFNNAPAISSPSLNGATITGTNPKLYTLDLTSYFQQQQAGGHNIVSVALTGTATTSAAADFSSTNGANPPALVLSTSTPTPTPTQATFGAAQDAYVQGGSFANDNFGSSTTLQVKQSSNDQSFTRESYLQFDLTGISSSATINSATLTLFGNINGSNSVQVDVLQVPDGTFNQNTITFNNSPATGVVVTSAVVSGSTAKAYTFNLTNYVQQDVAAGHSSQVTIALAGDMPTTQFASFNSTNAGSNQPSLAVSYQ